MTKIKTLKEKYPEFVIDIIDLISKRDPSEKNKYLPFMVETAKQHIIDYILTGNFLDDTNEQLFRLVRDFEKYSKLHMLKNKDIYSYPDLKSIYKEIHKAKEKDKDRQIKQLESIVLFEDVDRLLIKPLTIRAACTYGRGTEWCTSATFSENRFTDYASKGTLLYFIWKRPQPFAISDNWKKLAFNIKDPSEYGKIWDINDTELNPHDIIQIYGLIGSEIMGLINTEFKLNIPNRSIRKTDDGNIMLHDELFVNDRYQNDKLKIEEYMRSLQTNKQAPITFFSDTSIDIYEPNIGHEPPELGDEPTADDVDILRNAVDQNNSSNADFNDGTTNAVNSGALPIDDTKVVQANSLKGLQIKLDSD